jgi:hypothetical protein
MFSVAAFVTVFALTFVVYGLPNSMINGEVSVNLDAGWTKDSFSTVVFFGDSYTDEGRGFYFMSGAPKGAGWKEPAVSSLHQSSKVLWILLYQL